MFLYLGMSGHPHIHTPICLYTPYICTPPGVYTHPICPILFCACVFLVALHVVGVVMAPLCVGTPPLHHPFGGASPSIRPPHSVIVPCALVCSGISVYYVGISLLLKGLGVFPHQLGVWGHQHLRCPYAHSCTFFVVHYVSHCDYSSDYYSSSYSGIF